MNQTASAPFAAGSKSVQVRMLCATETHESPSQGWKCLGRDPGGLPGGSGI